MERLSGDDLRLACRVTHEKYKQCVKAALVKDVVGNVDPSAPARKCGGMFADLTEYCGEFLRTGELQGVGASGKGTGPR
jgi:hypothetical protein